MIWQDSSGLSGADITTSPYAALSYFLKCLIPLCASRRWGPRPVQQPSAEVTDAMSDVRAPRRVNTRVWKLLGASSDPRSRAAVIAQRMGDAWGILSKPRSAKTGTIFRQNQGLPTSRCFQQASDRLIDFRELLDAAQMLQRMREVPWATIKRISVGKMVILLP